MGRFYFHLRDGAALITDPEGTDLRDAAEAKRMAMLSARELVADAIKAGSPNVPEAFVIADDAGQTLLELPFVEVLPERLKVK